MFIPPKQLSQAASFQSPMQQNGAPIDGSFESTAKQALLRALALSEKASTQLGEYDPPDPAPMPEYEAPADSRPKMMAALRGLLYGAAATDPNMVPFVQMEQEGRQRKIAEARASHRDALAAWQQNTELARDDYKGGRQALLEALGASNSGIEMIGGYARTQESLADAEKKRIGSRLVKVPARLRPIVGDGVDEITVDQLNDLTKTVWQEDVANKRLNVAESREDDRRRGEAERAEKALRRSLLKETLGAFTGAKSGVNNGLKDARKRILLADATKQLAHLGADGKLAKARKIFGDGIAVAPADMELAAAMAEHGAAGLGDSAWSDLEYSEAYRSLGDVPFSLDELRGNAAQIVVQYSNSEDELEENLRAAMGAGVLSPQGASEAVQRWRDAQAYEIPAVGAPAGAQQAPGVPQAPTAAGIPMLEGLVPAAPRPPVGQRPAIPGIRVPGAMSTLDKVLGLGG